MSDGKEKLKVLYFLRDNGGCGFYRVEQPLITCKQEELLDVQSVKPTDNTEQIAAKMDWSDVLVCPRLAEGPFIHALEDFRKQGKKLIIDWDDNIFCLSPLSGHYGDFGTEPYSHPYKGGKLDVWVDGVNIDCAKNKKKLELAKSAMQMCDMVTCTTEILADVFRPFNKEVAVLPNCIDMSLWKRLPLQSHKGLRMGWFGGDSHYEDWIIMAQILPEFMRTNPQVTLVIMGTMFLGTLKEIDPKRIEYHSWVPTPAYPYKAAILDLDFSAIPLVDNDFNNCKSPIKWLEMAALQVPAVTSYVSPYAELSDLVKDNGIFVEANSAQGWWEGLNMMVNNAESRRRMGIAAYQTVQRHYDSHKNAHLWAEAFGSLLTPKALEVLA